VHTVVVTGAAGGLGRRVIAVLAGRADVGRIVALDVVGGGAAEGAAGPKSTVEWSRLDLARSAPSPDPLAGLVAGADAVFHLAWDTGDERGTTPAVTEIGEANLWALRRVLAVTSAPVFVFLSSATVYGAWADNPVPLAEDAPIRPNPGFGFAIGKAEAERVVAEWAAAHPEVAVTVLRPCAVVGAPGRPLYRALGGTRSPKADDGARPVQFLHVDDLANAAVTAWDQGLSGTFNVAPDSGIREDTARDLAGGLSRIPLPDRMADAVGHWRWKLWRTGVPKEAAAYSHHPWVVAADRMVGAGWRPRYTSEEALVAADERSHWDDLPPGRRQEFTLLVGAAALVAAAGGLTAAVLALRRRRARTSKG
jgi:nucleoside-diphosphate-sugar epimerase